MKLKFTITRRTTLFFVCAFEIALLMFVVTWSAQAETPYVFHCTEELRHNIDEKGNAKLNRNQANFTMKLTQNNLSFASSQHWIDGEKMNVSWLHDEFSFRAYGDDTTDAISIALGGGDFALTSSDQWYTSVSYGSCKLLD
ncbi:hypothetical protein PQZ40_01980 [Alphaproteobacteria bacterium]|nr:hypothetical protein [Alphaproteobacteria bacterium]